MTSTPPPGSTRGGEQREQGRCERSVGGVHLSISSLPQLILSFALPLHRARTHQPTRATNNEQRTAPHLSQLHDADASDVSGVAAPAVEERMVASAYIGEPSGSQDGTPTTFNNQGRCHRRAPRAFQGPQHRTLMGQCLAVLMNASGNAVDCFRVTSTATDDASAPLGDVLTQLVMSHKFNVSISLFC